ncbi:hypothetical protein BH24PSE2_BH24PSE2_20650 [soil metagenome]
MRTTLVIDGDILHAARERERRGGIGPSSLSDLGPIYCDGGKSVHFGDPFRQIA